MNAILASFMGMFTQPIGKKGEWRMSNEDKEDYDKRVSEFEEECRIPTDEKSDV